MMRFCLIILATATMVACAPKDTVADTRVTPDFEAALTQHFAAIQNRDLPQYTATITENESLPLIFPDGTLIATRAGVIDFHNEWFADPNWQMDIDRVNTIIGSDMAIATVKTAYRDTPDGADRYAYLALVFKLEGGEWRLVHDQNTRITN